MTPPPWLTKGGLHLRNRALWAAVFAVVALLVRLRLPSPPPRTAEGVAAMLGAAVGGEVRPDDFVWEERGGFLGDAFFGRWVLFLARRREPVTGAPSEPTGDLYRARVRLTRSGQPLAINLVRNLTRSPLGDDRELVARGHHAAFITIAAGAVQGITVLDLAGEGESREARTWRERARSSLESWFATGSTRGLGRIEVTFAAPPNEAREELEGGLLVMALGKEALPAALDLRDAALNTGPSNPHGAVAQRVPHRVRPFSDVAVETAHALFGPTPARALAAVFGKIEAGAAESRASRRPAPVVFPGAGPPRDPIVPVADWPPPKLSPVVQPPLDGEGVWAAGRGGASIGEGAPPALFETAIRPSPKQPRALVRLVAIDTRQLDLRLQAGIDEPVSLIGLRGAGRLPISTERAAPAPKAAPSAADSAAPVAPVAPVPAASASGSPGEPPPTPALANTPAPATPTVVAVFAGGPAARRGPIGVPSDVAAPPLGFIADRRLFVSPLPGAATIALARDGHAEIGPWSGDSAAPATPTLPAAFTSLRQTPDALLGWEGPAHIPLSPEDAAEPRDRSALCLLPSGQLLYGWGSDLDIELLSRALRLAGCNYAVPLAAGPMPSGFAYVRPSAQGLDATPLAPEMSLSAARIAAGSPSDLFYAVTRAPRPIAPSPSGSWAPDAGTQPSPAWLPGIHAATAVSLGARVHLTTFAAGRVAFRVRSGAKEPSTKASAALPGALPDAERPRALAAIALAAGRKKGARGLLIEGARGYPMRADDSGVLVIDGGRPLIKKPSELGETAAITAVELPLTADEAKLRPEAREVGTMRPRAAACVLDDGTLVIASTTFDSDEATTTALLDAGCGRVVALDRGSHHAFFLHRAGTESPPAPRYDATVLYAVDAPMAGRAGRLGSR